MSSHQTKNHRKNTKRFILSLLLFIFLVCFAGGKQTTLASLFASLPFTIPLFAHKSSHSRRKTMLSIIYGIAGIVLSVLILKQSGTFGFVKIFLGAFAGISVFLLNEFAFKNLEKSNRQTAFFLSFLVLFMVCYL